MGSSGRNRHRPGLLFQQFEVLEHGARQLVGIVNTFFAKCITLAATPPFAGTWSATAKARQRIDTRGSAD